MIELKALQGQVKILVDDLRVHIAGSGGMRSELQREYLAAKRAKRVGGTFETWLEGVLDQAAVAWVLGCVFVRFCEDNKLVGGLWIGNAETADRAVQARHAYIVKNPTRNDRDWLREAFTHLAGLRGTARLFDKHNPAWRFDIGGEAAEALSDFFRRGAGSVSLHDPSLNTRYLGDLYQDLSAYAKKTYALLQTPEFVEEFILDRTFEPAVKEFGLAKTSVIDPTCGSGHFLLGAFHRLVARWREREAGGDIREITQRALHQVTGVDINAFAVAIARFRLMVEALKVCGLSSLENAPAFDIRVATGDSLLPWGDARGGRQDQLLFGEPDPDFAFETEDEDLLADYLRRNQYTVVVGNPPYITVKDKVLNERYRALYPTCSGKYALTVPFAERFFGLAKRGDEVGDEAGWVGQITSNSFMKREFGKKLIDKFFGGHLEKSDEKSIQPIELVEIVDTSGAYIPGHGTPTVILVGLNRLVSARYSATIRTILGIRGEPSQPADPSDGLVWQAIADQIDRPGSESEWISAADSDRAQLNTHPWSMSGGGAGHALDLI